MWRKYESTDIISLKPVQQVSWELQTKPGQLEQEDYNKKTEPSFTKREHTSFFQKDPALI